MEQESNVSCFFFSHSWDVDVAKKDCVSVLYSHQFTFITCLSTSSFSCILWELQCGAADVFSNK